MSKMPPIDDPGMRRSSRGAEDPERNSQQALRAMIAKIWERSRTTVTQHVEVLQKARALTAKNMLDEPSRLRAVDSAHKLAGVLGTFGLPRGTDLARLAEEAFGQPTGMTRGELERVGAALDELSNLVKIADPSSRADSSAAS